MLCSFATKQTYEKNNDFFHSHYFSVHNVTVTIMLTVTITVFGACRAAAEHSDPVGFENNYCSRVDTGLILSGLPRIRSFLLKFNLCTSDSGKNNLGTDLWTREDL